MSACEHDAPKTYYAKQGATQTASPGPVGLHYNGAPTPVFYGALCDNCAHDAGLSPTAFGRDLQVTR